MTDDTASGDPVPPPDEDFDDGHAPDVLEAPPWVHEYEDPENWVDKQKAAALAGYPKAPANGTAHTNGAPPEADDTPLTPEQKIRAALISGDAICDVPPPDPLVGGVLNADSLAVLYGRPGGGKSVLALDWAMSIVTGSWWQGQEIAKPGNVLYVLAEGVRGTGQRVQAWKALNNYPPATPAGLVWLPMAVDLREPSWSGPLAYVAAELEPTLIVIDTLNRCAPGTDEGPADMGKVITAADLLRRITGACVLIVHHSGKDTTAGARGHSSLLGALDTELELKSAEGLLTLTITKQKDGADGATFHLALVPAGDSVAIGSRSRRPDVDGPNLSANGRTCLEALRRIAPPEGIPTSVWREASVDAGVSRTQFYEQVKRLREHQRVANLGTEARPAFIVAPERPDNPQDDEDF